MHTHSHISYCHFFEEKKFCILTLCQGYPTRSSERGNLALAECLLHSMWLLTWLWSSQAPCQEDSHPIIQVKSLQVREVRWLGQHHKVSLALTPLGWKHSTWQSGGIGRSFAGPRNKLSKTPFNKHFPPLTNNGKKSDLPSLISQTLTASLILTQPFEGRMG